MSYTRKPGSMLYSPPEGYYDLPFTWAYDASGLTNGLTYPNQYLYLQGGYGDFILRRVVGLSRILNTATGQYQIRDNASNFIESAPVFGVFADDIGIAPELRYQETGAIKFDLGIIALPTPASTAQIAFQGVRRMRGTRPNNPTYQARPHTFTYILPVSVPAGVGLTQTVRQLVSNYDFELYQTVILESTGGFLGPFVDEVQNSITFYNATTGAVTMTLVNTGVSHDPLVITVVGTSITIQYTNNNPLYNNADIATAIANNPAANALITAVVHNISGGMSLPGAGLGATVIAPVSFGPAGGLASLRLYDSNRIAVANAPILDMFMDGGPNGQYQNGAVVTPLWYPQNSQINIDVVSQTTLGVQMQILLVGRQWIPC